MGSASAQLGATFPSHSLSQPYPISTEQPQRIWSSNELSVSKYGQYSYSQNYSLLARLTPCIIDTPLLSSSTTPSTSIPPVTFSRTASSIRDRTVELANMPPMSSIAPPLALDYFTTQRTQSIYDPQPDESSVSSSFVDKASEGPLLQMTSSRRPDPSKLTLRLKDSLSPIAYRDPTRSPGSSLSPNHKSLYDSDNEDDEDSDPTPRRTPTKVLKNGRIPLYTCPSTETSSLLGSCPHSYSTLPVPHNPLLPAPKMPLRKRVRAAWATATNGVKTVSQPSYILNLGFTITSLLPSVFLGLLLNVLDGVSYGMILFPAVSIFDGFGPMGVSLFFIT
jgi:hypothetical protein